MTPKNKKTLVLLVGGGPAPGINGVIQSVTIEAVNSGLHVLGVYDGFKWLMQGDLKKVKPLTIEDVSHIHYSGGSILRTSRANPLESKKTFATVVDSLKKLGTDYLVTIGGDGTAFCAYELHQKAQDFFSVAHVPKTIDNDILLPGLMPTFGFHTARHYGTEMVQALMEDARTTSHWYFVATMGRKAGHLALGIGKAAGATLTIIGEEFKGRKIRFKDIADILEGAIIKRRAMGRAYGVAMLAEGLAECVEPTELRKYVKVRRDLHGRLPLDEIDLARILQRMVLASLEKRGLSVRIVPRNIGYELRCQPPIPFDCEYVQDLGYAAVRYLLNGGNGAVISIKRGGKMDPIPFEELIDSETGSMKIREVDIESDSYQVALKYMIRIEGKDFAKSDWVKKLAKAGNLSVKELKRRFLNRF